MKKKIFILAFCFTSIFFSLNAYSISSLLAFFIPAKSQACSRATPTNNPGFCQSFKTAAQCHCSERLPSGLCQDMNDIYNRMISVFRTQQAACEYQKDVTVQECMDDWNCYRLGKKDSQGRLCSGTGRAC